MNAMQQIASLAHRQQAQIDQQVRVDVFDGASVIALNLSGGTVAAGLQEIAMTDYQYYANCGVAEAGGIRILVPGIYVVYVYLRLPPSVVTCPVPLGFSINSLSAYTLLSTSYHVTGYDLFHSATGVRKLQRGNVIRLVTGFAAPTAWIWATLRIALVGMLR